ncbi:MAG TPA: MogA/MoaB family molybdenum cofactor biosynthesis protein [Candidatus Saccharimonadales bacterium]|jgi:molybdopterin adenylyltransferase|nr:MogA/MoaB family molybdenum cofactor biosynthesis protein [Candidatus Saccharimonadales bacterium]
MRVAILTISDSVSRGTHKDASGPDLRARCAHLNWEVESMEVFPDDPAAILDRLIALADTGAADLILTTGGTGIGPRDSTPEATTQACHKLLPGIAELMREEGRKKTPRAVLSRAVAGVRGRTIIVNLPGSPRGAVESFDAIADLLPHALQVLGGARHD